MAISTLNTIIFFVIVAKLCAQPAPVFEELPRNRLEETPGTIQGDMRFHEVRTRGVAIRRAGGRWTNGIVPYQFLPGHTSDQRQLILNAMRRLENYTAINNVRCVQFRPRVDTDVYYISIMNGTGCSSNVGMPPTTTFNHTVVLQSNGCLDDGRMMHEFIHTLGFLHEQSRPDRDSYVQVFPANIDPALIHNFDKMNNTDVDTQSISYDYESVMHYETTAFSINNQPTILPLQPNVKIGQRYYLSVKDVQQIQLFYSCTGSGTTLPPTVTAATTTTTVAPGVTTSTYSGSLAYNSPSYIRVNRTSGNFYYEAIQVHVPAAGGYAFKSSSMIDTYGYFYYSFNSTNPSVGYGFEDDDSSDYGQFRIGINFPSAYDFVFVVTTYNPNTLGPFLLIATGPTVVTFTKISTNVLINLTSTTSTTTPTTTTTKTTSTTSTTPTTTTTTTSTTPTTSTTSTTTTTKTTSTTTQSTTTTTLPTTTTAAASSVYRPINFFYPSDLTQPICPSNSSWTNWFNVGKPQNALSGDVEDMSVILAQNPTTMCRVPYSIQAQAINSPVNQANAQWYWSRPNNTLYLLSFQSFTPLGIDFRVRYCCPTGSFIATTITTTTPTPLDSTTCGKPQIAPSSRLVSRIFGGTNTVANSWPWMLYYQERRMIGNTLTYGICGATLISKDYALISAQCIGTKNPSDITLTAGMNDRSLTAEATRQNRTAQAIYVHPGYDPVVFGNDIAVIRVTDSFTLNAYVQPVCLPGGEAQIGDEVLTIGWGSQAMGGALMNPLQQTYMKVIGDCERWWSIADSTRQICTADSVSGSSACQGDAGSPLLNKYQGQYVVSGLTSYIRICQTSGTGNLPNVFTRVSAYRAWIKSITG